MDWLDEPRGKGLLWEEGRLMRAALDRVFGDYLLQVGIWGATDQFLRYSRVRHSALISAQTGSFQSNAEDPVSRVVTDPEHLAVASDSVDAVLLPHTLETTANPHQLLREVDRVLRPEGRLIVLGFNSPSWWSLRQKFSDGGFLPGVDHFQGHHRVTDWLHLLGFHTDKPCFYHPAKSVDRLVTRDAQADVAMDTQIQSRWWYSRLSRKASEQRGLLRTLRGWRHWRLTSACYMLEARKEVATLIPLKPARFIRPRLVEGLVNPSTRNVVNINKNVRHPDRS